MVIPSGQKIGCLIQLAKFGLAVSVVPIPMRVEEIATRLGRRILLFVRDLDGFVSLCLARFIVWKRMRGKR